MATEETFCDFYQFSWQWFLAQVSPADPANPSGDRVFERNRLYDPDGPSNQCSLPSSSGRAVALTLLRPRGVKPSSFEHTQAWKILKGPDPSYFTIQTTDA